MLPSDMVVQTKPDTVVVVAVSKRLTSMMTTGLLWPGAGEQDVEREQVRNLGLVMVPGLHVVTVEVKRS
jgi:hypothetical protein